MKAFRIFFRSIRDSFKGVFRNFSLSLASISCITITLLVVAISIALSYNVNNFAKSIEKDVTIVAFIKNGTSEEEMNSIKDKITLLNNIDTVTFDDKAKITQEIMDSSDTFKSILENMEDEENPIQNTYLVKVQDINGIKEVADAIKAMDNITAVKYGEGMVEQLISVFKAIKNVSIGAVIALIIVTAFLISNTIKITIFSRRKEIEIMRLVGASNLNIKIPFIFEGLILGILGAIIPILVTVYGYAALYQNFSGQLFSPFIKLIRPEPFIYQVSAILLLIGMLVGMFGSLRAAKKHLKV